MCPSTKRSQLFKTASAFYLGFAREEVKRGSTVSTTGWAGLMWTVMPSARAMLLYLILLCTGLFAVVVSNASYGRMNCSWLSNWACSGTQTVQDQQRHSCWDKQTGLVNGAQLQPWAPHLGIPGRYVLHQGMCGGEKGCTGRNMCIVGCC